MSRRSVLIKLALVVCLLPLLWLGYETLPRDDLQKTRNLLEEERKRCLYRQGLDPSGYLASNSSYSQFSCNTEQYPGGLCTVNLLYLSHDEKKFIVRGREQSLSRLNSELSALAWPVGATNLGWPSCTQYYDEAFVISLDNSPSDDHYYHLHMSVLIPLYSLLAYRKHLGPPTNPGYTVALLPAIEDYSLQVWVIKGHMIAVERSHDLCRKVM